jgi:hypothetical protein
LTSSMKLGFEALGIGSIFESLFSCSLFWVIDDCTD